jgi:hypothetical protein
LVPRALRLGDGVRALRLGDGVLTTLEYLILNQESIPYWSQAKVADLCTWHLQPHLDVCPATAGRLAEIARRNRIRQDAGLPLLSITKELRRMKRTTDAAEFGYSDGQNCTIIVRSLQRLNNVISGNECPSLSNGHSSGGYYHLDGSRVSPQLPKLPHKKSRHRGYAKGQYFVEH